ncbi:MAG: helix-turn-helix domain-containing protein [Gaiella sp.]|nr:helix-turn-helix domain-containing protein [Gaiella sp.]
MSVRSIKDVAAAVRGRRHDLGISQVELARRAGVSRKWISEFEAGKSTAEFGLVLRVLDALALSLELRDASSTQDGPSDRGAVDLDLLLNRFRASDAAEAGDE